MSMAARRSRSSPAIRVGSFRRTLAGVGTGTGDGPPAGPQELGEHRDHVGGLGRERGVQRPGVWVGHREGRELCACPRAKRAVADQVGGACQHQADPRRVAVERQPLQPAEQTGCVGRGGGRPGLVQQASSTGRPKPPMTCGMPSARASRAAARRVPMLAVASRCATDAAASGCHRGTRPPAARLPAAWAASAFHSRPAALVTAGPGH